MKNRMSGSNRLILQIWLACALVGALCGSAAAQRVEIFGGYQFTHLQPAYNANGWNASLTGNFKHVLGITGDFSGAYNNGEQNEWNECRHFVEPLRNYNFRSRNLADGLLTVN